MGKGLLQNGEVLQQPHLENPANRQSPIGDLSIDLFIMTDGMKLDECLTKLGL